ncbi:hypothetical protein [uncultured Parolsenella sp.]|uniref:hypothetical protein n=1 Tax=uncultured Parolsenella sp. TaxID=2083008 RepID=UPI0025F4829A|nr:hypothetical protein [uncultured Parolsenella sp.]
MKMKPAMVLRGILAALDTLGVIGRIVANDFSMSLIAQAIVSWLIFYGSLKVHQSSKQ